MNKMRRGAHATTREQTNHRANARRAQNIIFEMRENEPAGSSHRLSRLKYTYRQRLLYSICYSAGRWVRSHFWRAILARSQTQRTHHQQHRSRTTQESLVLARSSHNSYLVIRRRFHRQLAGLPKVLDSRLTQLVRFAKHEELHCPLYPPLWSVLRLDPGRPSCRRDPVRGQPYARHGRANWF